MKSRKHNEGFDQDAQFNETQYFEMVFDEEGNVVRSYLLNLPRMTCVTFSVGVLVGVIVAMLCR